MRVLPEAPSQTMWRRRVRISLDSVDTARFSSWCSSAPTYAGHRDGLDRLRAIGDGEDAFDQYWRKWPDCLPVGTEPGFCATWSCSTPPRTP